MYKLGGEDVGAAYTLRPDQRDQGVPPNWLVYIAVPNVDQAIARAELHGATLLSPAFDVMEYGRMAVLRDPQGAVFAIWQAETTRRNRRDRRSGHAPAGASSARRTRPTAAASTPMSLAGRWSPERT